MMTARGVFEVHLAVSDLEQSIAFYRDTLGLELARREPARGAAFFWVGRAGGAMIGLWHAGPAPQRVTSHTAFRASLADVLAAPAALQAAGVTPLDFDHRPTDQPIVFGWMPAASIFFRDPDGHLLEYIAMLPEPPRADYGVVPWRMWQLLRHASPVGP